MKKNILVLCTGNSCRSQMAHGFLNAIASEHATIYSAGIETHGLNPGAVSIMKDVWVQVESFPLTGSGKIQEFVLRDRFVAGEFTQL